VDAGAARFQFSGREDRPVLRGDVKGGADARVGAACGLLEMP
jgi:hypothetical protein